MTAQPGQHLYRVGLTKVTSFIVMTYRRSTVYTGTLEQLEARAKSVMTHNLLLGWWGIPAGFIWTPMALSKNSKNMRKIRELHANKMIQAPGPTAGPYGAPAAQPYGQPAPGMPYQAPPGGAPYGPPQGGSPY